MLSPSLAQPLASLPPWPSCTPISLPARLTNGLCHPNTRTRAHENLPSLFPPSFLPRFHRRRSYDVQLRCDEPKAHDCDPCLDRLFHLGRCLESVADSEHAAGSASHGARGTRAGKNERDEESCATERVGKVVVFAGIKRSQPMHTCDDRKKV